MHAPPHYSQSRCFFLGPMISCVVALHTVLETAEPVTLCCAAVIRSVMLCPDILHDHSPERSDAIDPHCWGYRLSVCLSV